MIGTSISEAYYPYATSQFASDKNALQRVYVATLVKAFRLGIIPALGVFIAGDYLVDLIFGEKWDSAGYYLQIMIFWIFVMYLWNCVSYTFNILNRLNTLLILNVGLLVVRFVAMGFATSDPGRMIMALSITSGIMYVVYIVTGLLMIRREIKL